MPISAEIGTGRKMAQFCVAKLGVGTKFLLKLRAVDRLGPVSQAKLGGSTEFLLKLRAMVGFGPVSQAKLGCRHGVSTETPCNGRIGPVFLWKTGRKCPFSA